MPVSVAPARMSWLDYDPFKYRAHYERSAVSHARGVIEWDGRLLDGWLPV